MVLLFLGLGAQEVIVILFIVLLMFGSKKLPELARGLGKGIREFKDATGDIQNEIRKGMHEVEKPIREVEKDINSKVKEK
jgi:sec-independent protein translocase protein TatA